MQPKHTPMPELFVERLRAVGNMPEEFQIESDGRAFAVCHNQEDAERIARAVNAHEELLDAAKDALCWLDPDCKQDGVKITEDSSDKEKMIVRLYDAIAKAEGPADR